MLIPIEGQPFEYRLHPDFVAILEAVRQGLLDAVDLNRRTVDAMSLYAGVKRLTREPVEPDRWILQSRRFRPSAYRDGYLMGNLRRDVMEM